MSLYYVRAFHLHKDKKLNLIIIKRKKQENKESFNYSHKMLVCCNLMSLLKKIFRKTQIKFKQQQEKFMMKIMRENK